MVGNKAVFIDRDGTINVDKRYLYKIEDFEFKDGIIEGMKQLQDEGFLLFIITNQSGIARGYYTEKDLLVLNEWLIKKLKDFGVNVSKIYYCPHHPDAVIDEYKKDCECRKPKLGMFKMAIEEFDLDLSKCYAVGDNVRDCAICKKSSGCRGYIIGAQKHLQDDLELDIQYVGSFKDAVNCILKAQ